MNAPKNDPLEALDFEMGNLECEIIRQPWIHKESFFGLAIPKPFDLVPIDGDCPHPAKMLVKWRPCVCITNVNMWEKLHPELAKEKKLGPTTLWGLCVVSVSMCENHIRYFAEYLTYPFACPRCGVAYNSPHEILVGGADLNPEG